MPLTAKQGAEVAGRRKAETIFYHIITLGSSNCHKGRNAALISPKSGSGCVVEGVNRAGSQIDSGERDRK